MTSLLRTKDDQLRDLAEGSPALIEAASGKATGARLVRCIGVGGMATVFLAELDQAQRSGALSEQTPPRLVVKMMQVSTERSLRHYRIDPLQFFSREAVALGRVAEREPPTEFVVGYHGAGWADVEVAGGGLRRLPWLALEWVDGGSAGGSLTERVQRSPEGIDPVRALRLVKGLLAGVRVLHDEGVIHRDLKPANVLVAGPVDVETPKLADCGIARVSGMATSVPGMTFSYGGPEQLLSVLGEANPLVGPWTDVHALAAIVWYLVGGETWCPNEGDLQWIRGARRSLFTAGKVHRGFGHAILASLDGVLRRGAAAKLPAAAWQANGAKAYSGRNAALEPSAQGPERFEGVEGFAAALLPILEDAASRWTASAAREQRAVTTFRPTQLLRFESLRDEPAAEVREISPAGGSASWGGAPIDPECIVFQPDGKVLVRSGRQLAYYVQDTPYRVKVSAPWESAVADAKWIVRGPEGGFALVSATRAVLIRGGAFSEMSLPAGVAAGQSTIVAALGDGRAFGIVTSETDDSGGPELWLAEGGTWSEPHVLPMKGDLRAIAYGPYGFLVVGGMKNRGRAIFVGLDDTSVDFMKDVKDKPALTLALCGAERDAWAAGEGCVLRFGRGSAALEDADAQGAPVALGLDPAGVPWLVTRHTVLRRHVDEAPRWRLYYRRDESRRPLAGIGFTPQGARVLDVEGNVVQIAPRDVASWKDAAST